MFLRKNGNSLPVFLRELLASGFGNGKKGDVHGGSTGMAFLTGKNPGKYRGKGKENGGGGDGYCPRVPACGHAAFYVRSPV